MALLKTLAQRNWGARIREYTHQDMQLVVLENELLGVGVLAGKGADIVELNDKPRDLDLVWLSPNGVQNPRSSAGTSRDPLATFVETYPGGWQEIFPNGGAPSSYSGAQYGQHDETFALAWDAEIVEDTTEAIAVRFTVHTHKVPCVIEKTMRMVTAAPVLARIGIVPKVQPGPQQVFTMVRPHTNASEAMRLLRTNLEFAAASDPPPDWR